MQYSHASKLYAPMVEELLNPPLGPRLPLFPRISEKMGGLRPHELTLLCAPTGSGKTELIASFAAQLTQTGVPTFVAPVETGDVDFLARVTSSVAKYPLNQGIAVPLPRMQDIERTYGNRLRKLPLFIAHYDNRVSVEEIKTVLEYVVRAEHVQVALLDNLNFFLDVVSQDMERAEMDSAIHELVMFCKQFPLHIVLVVHPRKTVAGRVESEFDIKGSSTAVQECANVALFNRPTKEDLEDGHEMNHRELVFRKLRKRGAYVNQPVWLSYEHGYYTEIVEEKRNEKNAFRHAGKGQRYIPPGSD